MAAPEVEVERVWAALHANSDRITFVEETTKERIDGLEDVLNTRNELMRESIHSAVRESVREAMPSRFPTEAQLYYLDAAIERQAQSIAFRRKVIESTTIWAVIIVIGAFFGGLGVLIRDWAIAHNLWVPNR